MTGIGTLTVTVTGESDVQLHPHDVRQFEILVILVTNAIFHRVISMLAALAAILETGLLQLDRHSQILQLSALAPRIAAVELDEAGVAGSLEEEGGLSTLTIVTDIMTLGTVH